MDSTPTTNGTNRAAAIAKLDLDLLEEWMAYTWVSTPFFLSTHCKFTSLWDMILLTLLKQSTVGPYSLHVLEALVHPFPDLDSPVLITYYHFCSFCAYQ